MRLAGPTRRFGRYLRIRAFCSTWFCMTVALVGCDHDQPSPERTRSSRTLRKVNPAINQPSRLEAIDQHTEDSEKAIDRDDDWFEEVTSASGLQSVYRNGQESHQAFILESLGGGVALIDYDCDGDLDAFLIGGGLIETNPITIRGLPGKLFRNDAEFQFVNVSAPAAITVESDYSHGCFGADYDNDGFQDLLVTCYGRCRLFRNQGDGSFEEVSQVAGLVRENWWTGAAWGDIDHDGFVDLMVTGYVDWSPELDRPCHNSKQQRDVCSPNRYRPADNCLFRNQGNGTFSDISKQVGMIAGGNGLGIVAADINADRLVDFYVANDESDNFLYLGTPNGQLREVGHQTGVAVNQYGTHEGSMGVDAGDFDGDGLVDLWVTNFEHEDNALYRNLGHELFEHSTTRAGLAGRSRLYVGFGTALEDFDGDGHLDLFVANGHVFYHGGELPYRQRPQLFRNTGNSQFEDVSTNGAHYFRSNHSGRGSAVGDLDNDGDFDLLVVHQNEPASLLRNRAACRPHVRLKLVGTRANRDAVGARVVLRNQPTQQVRLIKSGSGYFSHSDQRIVFSITTSQADVLVAWPGGESEIFRSLSPGQTQILVEGHGERDDSE